MAQLLILIFANGGAPMRPSTFKAIVIATFTTLVAISSAAAADLAARPYTKAPVMVEVYNWTGFYIGGNAGYAGAVRAPTFHISTPPPVRRSSHPQALSSAAASI